MPDEGPGTDHVLAREGHGEGAKDARGGGGVDHAVVLQQGREVAGVPGHHGALLAGVAVGADERLVPATEYLHGQLRNDAERLTGGKMGLDGASVAM